MIHVLIDDFEQVKKNYLIIYVNGSFSKCVLRPFALETYFNICTERICFVGNIANRLKKVQKQRKHATRQKIAWEDFLSFDTLLGQCCVNLNINKVLFAFYCDQSQLHFVLLLSQRDYKR